MSENTSLFPMEEPPCLSLLFQAGAAEIPWDIDLSECAHPTSFCIALRLPPPPFRTHKKSAPAEEFPPELVILFLDSFTRWPWPAQTHPKAP